MHLTPNRPQNRAEICHLGVPVGSRAGPGGVPGGPGGAPGRVPGGSRGDLEGSWGTFGGLGNAPGDLEGSWADLGAVLGPKMGQKISPKRLPRGSKI